MQRNHLSASQINRFIDEPALWILDRLFDVRGTVGPGAWRGSAIEAACDVVLLSKASDDVALKTANDRFEQDAQGDMADEVHKERLALPVYLHNLLPTIRGLGMPLTRQSKIVLQLPTLDMDIIGYVDWRFPDYLLDLKTTGRMPSLDPVSGRIKDKAEHVRQVAIYERAESVTPRLCYATPGKPDKGQQHKAPLIYTPDRNELDAAIRQVEAAGRAMQRLLKSTSERESIAEMYPPRDFGSYLWDDKTRAEAARIWRL
jgi:hypothetical protein